MVLAPTRGAAAGLVVAIAAASAIVVLSKATAASNIKSKLPNPTVRLSNGVLLPLVAVGTGMPPPRAVMEDVVPMALDIGFTHFDASCVEYGNEAELGDALAQQPRDAFFLTTKIDPPFGPIGDGAYNIWPPDVAYAETMTQVRSCLKAHRVTHFDLLILHKPPGDPWAAFTPGKAHPGKPLTDYECTSMRETWRAMQDIYKAGTARAIGVSNFCPSTFECLTSGFDAADLVMPMVNQVQYHVGMGADSGGIRTYSEENGIALQAYSPLALRRPVEGSSTELITGELVNSIGAKYGKTGAQVALRWLVQRDISVAVQSASQSHLFDDLDLFDFALSDEDVAALDAAASPGGHYSFKCGLGPSPAPPLPPCAWWLGPPCASSWAEVHNLRLESEDEGE